jgi:hypothetical protein
MHSGTAIGQYQDHLDGKGRVAVVRNGYLPARTITTGVGGVEIQDENFCPERVVCLLTKIGDM